MALLNFAERSTSEVRCAYCHDALDDRARLERCGSCEVALHRDCWRAHGGCATAGCAEWAPRAQADERPGREPRGRDGPTGDRGRRGSRLSRPVRRTGSRVPGAAPPPGPTPTLDVRVATRPDGPLVLSTELRSLVGAVIGALVACPMAAYVHAAHPDLRLADACLVICGPLLAALGALACSAVEPVVDRSGLRAGVRVRPLRIVGFVAIALALMLLPFDRVARAMPVVLLLVSFVLLDVYDDE